MTLTVHKIMADIAELEARIAQGADNEGLHCVEDRILFDALNAIASGDHEDSAKEIAAAAIKVAGLPYERWYA